MRLKAGEKNDPAFGQNCARASTNQAGSTPMPEKCGIALGLVAGQKFRVDAAPRSGRRIDFVASGGEMTAPIPSRTIIFADEDPQIRDLAMAHFRSRGDQIITVAQDAEALDLLGKPQIHIDLVISEIDTRSQMGVGLLSALRTRAKAPPSIVLTHPADGLAIDRALELGAMSLLNKPLNWRLLDHQIDFVGRALAHPGEAERADQGLYAKSQVMASMRHELRTPLNGVIGFSQLIALRSHQTGDEAISRQVANVLTAAGRLKHILDDLLLYAEMSTGETELTLEACSVRQLLQQTFERLGADDPDDLDIVVHAPDLLLRIDSQSIATALAHLVTNALAHGARPVRIVIAPVLVPQNRFGNGLMTGVEMGASLAVLDAGEGIDVSDCYVETSELGQGREGLGLGLAIARAAAALHGGALKLGTSPWGGLSAVIVLPANCLVSPEDRGPIVIL